MTKRIIAKFPLHGASEGKAKPTFEAEGFQGESCRTATQAFMNALGTVDNEEIKPEMYETEVRHEHLNEGGQ